MLRFKAMHRGECTDLKEVNMIDPFHLEVYEKISVNYNRDIEIFPLLHAVFIQKKTRPPVF